MGASGASIECEDMAAGWSTEALEAATMGEKEKSVRGCLISERRRKTTSMAVTSAAHTRVLLQSSNCSPSQGLYAHQSRLMIEKRLLVIALQRKNVQQRGEHRAEFLLVGLIG